MRVLWTPLEVFIRCTVTATPLILDYAQSRAGVFRISVYVGEMSFVLILRSW